MEMFSTMGTSASVESGKAHTKPQAMDPISPQTTTCYDLIIFDCDGVLVDSEALSCRCLMELLRRHGIDIELDTVFDKFLGRSIAAVADHYQELGCLLPGTCTASVRALVLKSSRL